MKSNTIKIVGFILFLSIIALMVFGLRMRAIYLEGEKASCLLSLSEHLRAEIGNNPELRSKILVSNKWRELNETDLQALREWGFKPSKKVCGQEMLLEEQESKVRLFVRRIGNDIQVNIDGMVPAMIDINIVSH